MRVEAIVKFFTDMGFDLKTHIAFQGDTFTVSRAVLTKKKRTILTGEGVARKSPKDKDRKETGRGIATTRACMAIYKKFHRKSRRVHHHFMG